MYISSAPPAHKARCWNTCLPSFTQDHCKFEATPYPEERKRERTAEPVIIKSILPSYHFHLCPALNNSHTALRFPFLRPGLPLRQRAAPFSYVMPGKFVKARTGCVLSQFSSCHVDSRELNSSHEVWWQMPLPTIPPRQQGFILSLNSLNNSLDY